MYDTWGLVAEKPKGSWRPFTKHTRTNCAVGELEFVVAATGARVTGGEGVEQYREMKIVIRESS